MVSPTPGLNACWQPPLLQPAPWQLAAGNQAYPTCVGCSLVAHGWEPRPQDGRLPLFSLPRCSAFTLQSFKDKLVAHALDRLAAADDGTTGDAAGLVSAGGTLASLVSQQLGKSRLLGWKDVGMPRLSWHSYVCLLAAVPCPSGGHPYACPTARRSFGAAPRW